MVYLQSDNDKSRPHHFDVACAMYGCIDLGWDYKLTSFEEVVGGKWDNIIKNGNPFVGSVEFMREVFNRINKTDVRLPKNNDQEPEILSVGEVKSRVVNGEELFIKPKEIKLFSGMVMNQNFISCLNGIDDSVICLSYKPFSSKIRSEWRLYIHDKKIVDSKNYSGDFRLCPDYELASKRIESLNDFPCTYTMDVAIFDYGVQDEVVEYNDMWSIGNYGIDNILYMRMLSNRFREIIKS